MMAMSRADKLAKITPWQNSNHSSSPNSSTDSGFSGIAPPYSFRLTSPEDGDATYSDVSSSSTSSSIYNCKKSIDRIFVEALRGHDQGDETSEFYEEVNNVQKIKQQLYMQFTEKKNLEAANSLTNSNLPPTPRKEFAINAANEPARETTNINFNPARNLRGHSFLEARNAVESVIERRTLDILRKNVHDKVKENKIMESRSRESENSSNSSSNVREVRKDLAQKLQLHTTDSSFPTKSSVFGDGEDSSICSYEPVGVTDSQDTFKGHKSDKLDNNSFEEPSDKKINEKLRNENLSKHFVIPDNRQNRSLTDLQNSSTNENSNSFVAFSEDEQRIRAKRGAESNVQNTDINYRYQKNPNATVTSRNRQLSSPVSSRQRVEYIGALSLTLQNKSISLKELQKPLKAIYLNFLRRKSSQGDKKVDASLEITNSGLKIKYQLKEQRKEFFNPFSSIAVWAAVKFVCKQDYAGKYVYAFVPLISNPNNEEKNRHYIEMDGSELNASLTRNHPPIFACVMRRQVQRALECHAFMCDTGEEAILLAANLYQALLQTMQNSKRQVSTKKPVENTPEDTFKTEEDDLYEEDEVSENEPPVPPKVPSRRKKHTYESMASQRRKNFRASSRSSRKRRSNRSIKRNDSRRKSVKRTIAGNQRMSSNISKKDSIKIPLIENGDIYTRVAMPKSKDSMSVHTSSDIQELFCELREKEGIENIDDILRKVLSPDNMSFNSVKPVYKEIILKLAMTMTKDEMFRRSKNILSEQKKTKKSKGSNSRNQSKDNKKVFANTYPFDPDDSKFSKLFRTQLFNKPKFSSVKISGNQDSSKAKKWLDKKYIDLGYGSYDGRSLKSRSSPSRTFTKQDISNPIPIEKSRKESSSMSSLVTSLPSVDKSNKECCFDSDCSKSIYSSVSTGTGNVIARNVDIGESSDFYEDYCFLCEKTKCSHKEKCYCSIGAKNAYVTRPMTKPFIGADVFPAKGRSNDSSSLSVPQHHHPLKSAPKHARSIENIPFKNLDTKPFRDNRKHASARNSIAVSTESLYRLNKDDYCLGSCLHPSHYGTKDRLRQKTSYHSCSSDSLSSSEGSQTSKSSLLRCRICSKPKTLLRVISSDNLHRESQYHLAGEEDMRNNPEMVALLSSLHKRRGDSKHGTGSHNKLRTEDSFSESSEEARSSKKTGNSRKFSGTNMKTYLGYFP